MLSIQLTKTSAFCLTALSLMIAQGQHSFAQSYQDVQTLNLNMSVPNAEVMSFKTSEFLSPDLMQSPYHTVQPTVLNNGVSNTYIIDTPHGQHSLQGTEQAKIRIFEIAATEQLRKRTMVGAALKSTRNRTVNLVTTPIRIVELVGDRIDAVDSAEDAVFFLPETAGYVIGVVLKGVGEIGVTGARIVKGAGNASCSGLNCVTELGSDAWSGINSIVGKHNSARRLHAELGTNPETRNKDLRRQIDRLSYADAYTGTAYKIGLGTGYANIDYFSPVVTGVGYVNNGEFLESYKDAHRLRNKNKAKLREWGVTEADIKTLYANPSYTKSMRREIGALLLKFGTPQSRNRLIQIAKDAETPYIARQNLASMRYLTKAFETGEFSDIAPESTGSIGVTPSGKIVMPYMADYLRWTPHSEQNVDYLARIKSQSNRYNSAEIRILGKASPEFIQKAQAKGIRVTEIF